MLKPLLVLAPLAVPAAAPPDAQTVHVIRAAGFGHGVGLSQFGAYGFARKGRDYRRILRHYYRGAELSRVSPTETSVLVRRGYSAASFRGAGRIGDRRARPKVAYTARPGGPGIELYRGRKKVGRFTSPLRISRRGVPVQLLGKADTGIADGSYRGSLILHRARGGLMVVNRLPLDEYVRGVVPSEMPASWHPEALKSQAVAARSYALASPPRSDLYDHLPDTRSQVYTGVSGEQPESSAAVRATARQALTWRGKPIVAFFFSTSGGRTENAENSFVDSGPRPYLVSVPDPYDRISPRHRSELRMSDRELARRLRGRYEGRFVGVRVTKRGVSPRIVRARIVGTKGSGAIDGGKLRTLVGLPDTWAYFHKAVSWSGRRRISGWFEPRGTGRVTIERRSRGRWRPARRGAESFTGDFSMRVRPGIYRARSGRVTGPTVKVGR
jgi:stage II sporulation protein D